MDKAEIEPDRLYSNLRQAWIRVSAVSRQPAGSVKAEAGMPIIGILTLLSPRT